MAKRSEQPPPADPATDIVEASQAIDRMADSDDKKLRAFNAVIEALKDFSQADRYALLNAAAKFHGFSIKLDV